MSKYIDAIPIYFKIPITTRYSDELLNFPQDKGIPVYVVEGKELCEKDIFGDACRCWYVSTVFGVSEDKEWLLKEIAELGCIPTYEEFSKGFFKTISNGFDVVHHEQSEVDLENAARHVYESWLGGTMDDVRLDMVTLGKVLNARKED